MMKSRRFYLKPVLQAMRREGIVSQRELARAAGTTQATICRLFKNRSCRERTMQGICAALKLNINRLRDISADTAQLELPLESDDK